MPRIRKCFIHNSVVEVCFRTERDLPFIANSCVTFLLRGILAAAQSLYPVTVCHFCVMANHVHLILVVEDPEDVHQFVGYFKRESSHAINRLRGNEKLTVWCEGYDSPTILDAAKVMDRIRYLYNNPVTGNLEETIEQAPNLSSWCDFLKGGSSETYFRVPRDGIPQFPRGEITEAQTASILAELKENATLEYTFTVEPDAWMQCFDESKDAEPSILNEKILDGIRLEERLLAEKRTSPVIGAKALASQDIRKSYTPKKRGKRMICLGSTKAIRKVFIGWFRERSKEAKESFQKIKIGIQDALPPGMFLPGGYLLSNLSPPFSPLPLA